MNFTQRQLVTMTDLELNIVAANHFYDCDEITVTQSEGDSVQVICNGVTVDDEYNPCQDSSDCGDLIDELGLFFPNTESKRRTVTIIYILIKQGVDNETN